MTKLSTPKGMRLHVGIFGRRNVGKSSLLNAMVRQHVSLVSDVAGTTTDPVEKPMELLPLGPVLFIDTAGIDDEGALGDLRVKRTTEVFDRTDLGLIVAAGEWGPFEEALVREMQARKVPLLVAFNKSDVAPASAAQLAACMIAGCVPSRPARSRVPGFWICGRRCLVKLHRIISTVAPSRPIWWVRARWPCWSSH